MGKKKRWVRLRRALQKLKLIDVPIPKGDGGLMTDDFLNRHNNTFPKDTTLIVKDSTVVIQSKQ